MTQVLQLFGSEYILKSHFCYYCKLTRVSSHHYGRTRSALAAAHRVVECYYPGSAGAQSERGDEESAASEGEGIRGRRQGVSESALPRPLCAAMGKVVLDALCMRHGKCYGKLFVMVLLEGLRGIGFLLIKI